jgi:hypothetical protein
MIMTLPAWWTNRLKTDYTPRGLFVRVAVDLVLSNLGLLLGILTTVGFKAFSWTEMAQTFFRRMFIEVWLANVPILTAFCLFAYAINGLYRGTRDVPYRGRVLAVIKAVGTAFLLFLLWIYLSETFIPRSTMAAGWFFIFALILSSRLFSTAFFLQYHVIPTNAYDPRIEQIVRELTLLSHQDGWLPPECLPPKAAWPHFEEDEVLAAAAVLNSGKINQWTGSEVERFQEEFAAFCGVRHAVALANGSVALELALHVLDIGPGDEVIVTPRTFVVSAGCVALRGAKPVFVDVDRVSQNMSVEAIRQAVTPRTRAIIAVHLAGWPCEMDPILDVAEAHGLKVIEDCAQCHGAVYYSRRTGRLQDAAGGAPLERDGVRLYPRMTGSLGDMAAFSFCQDKIMTTGGEGGMLLTDDDALWEKAWAFKDHGKSYDAVYRQAHPSGFRWLHESFGTNWRLTEMQAAIGRRQLRKLPDWVAARQRNAAVLTEAFSGIAGLRVTPPPEHVRHVYYKYYVFVRPERLKAGWNRDRIMNAVTAAGAPCFSGSCSEVYLERAFDGNGLRPAERLPVARELGETSLMFLVHPTLTEKDMERVAAIVGTVMNEATESGVRS